MPARQLDLTGSAAAADGSLSDEGAVQAASCAHRLPISMATRLPPLPPEPEQGDIVLWAGSN